MVPWIYLSCPNCKFGLNRGDYFHLPRALLPGAAAWWSLQAQGGHQGLLPGSPQHTVYFRHSIRALRNKTPSSSSAWQLQMFLWHLALTGQSLNAKEMEGSVKGISRSQQGLSSQNPPLPQFSCSRNTATSTPTPTFKSLLLEPEEGLKSSNFS